MNNKLFLKLSFGLMFLCIGLETRPICGYFRTYDMLISLLVHKCIESKSSHCIYSFCLKRVITEN